MRFRLPSQYKSHLYYQSSSALLEDAYSADSEVLARVASIAVLEGTLKTHTLRMAHVPIERRPRVIVNVELHKQILTSLA